MLLVYRHEPLEEATATRAVRNLLFSLSACSLQRLVNVPGFHPFRSVQIPIDCIRICVAQSPLFLEPCRVLRQLDHCTRQILGHQVFHRVFIPVLPRFVRIPADDLGDGSSIQKFSIFPVSEQKLGRRIPSINPYGGFGQR